MSSQKPTELCLKCVVVPIGDSICMADADATFQVLVTGYPAMPF